ncbi:MAG: anthranilate synthase component 2 [Halobacteriales archaeon]|jgi:anthranilate synthase component 2
MTSDRADTAARDGRPPETDDRDATVLVIDNYDSFVYNLVQYVGELAGEVVVRRNDAIDAEGIRGMDPDGIVVSPGPGTPAEAGVSMPVFRDLRYPTLGVCLGHQALCAVHGAPVGLAPEVVHGKPSTIRHDGEGIFADLPERIRVGRYHSLAVEAGDLPSSLARTASTDDERDVLMAVRHRDRPHLGVQFHPESILTGEVVEREAGQAVSLHVGKRIVGNFLDRYVG